MRRLVLLLIVVAVAAGSAALLLWPGRGATVLVSDARAEAVADWPGSVAVTLSIDNRGGPDRLIGVESPEGEAFLIAPEAPDGAGIPARSRVEMVREGAHVRLVGLAGDLAQGRLIPLTLLFETAGPVATRARIGAPDPLAPPPMDLSRMTRGDVCAAGEGEDAVRLALSLDAAKDGRTVAGETAGFTLRPDLMDGPGSPGTGHGHPYVGGLKLGRLLEPKAGIPALPPGRHVVRVMLSTNDHQPYVVDGVPISATLLIEAP